MSKSAMLRQYEHEHELENAVRRLGLCVTRPWSTTEPRVWLRAVGPSARTGRWIVWPEFSADQQEVDTPTAALFLLLLGLPEVAVTCPDCLARGANGRIARWEWCHRWAFDWRPPGSARFVPAIDQRRVLVGHLANQGWTVGWTAGRTVGFDIVASRPCPTCTVDGEPIGRVMREPARLLLDAMAVEGGTVWLESEGLPALVKPEPADPVARERIAVLADELQAIGNHRGEWLALWLRGAVETEAGHTMPIDTALPAIAVELRGLQ